MNTEMQTPRIVGKSEYFKNLSLRCGLSISSLCLLLLTIGSGITTLLTLASPEALIVGFSTVLLPMLLVISVNQTKSLEKVVLLTHANTADLPDPASLVRASDRPTQEQGDILLRATIEAPETPAEQLLRPADSR